MTQEKRSLIKYFKYLIFSMILGSIAISVINFSNAKNNFKIKTEEQIKHNALKIAQKIDDSLIYAENVTNLLATRISKQTTFDAKAIAPILEGIKPKIDNKKYDIFTWTLYDFVNPKGQVIATSSSGVAVKNNMIVSASKRSWMVDARIKPWKFHVAKSDIGIVSKESIIPIGFGVTDKKDNFLGIISLGINTNKLRRILEVSLKNLSTNFIILNNDGSIITTSENLEHSNIASIEKELLQVKKFNTALSQNQFFTINNQVFYHAQITNYPKITILVGANKRIIRTEFLSEILPKILNTVYLTIFFIILLFFFKRRLLMPIIYLSKSAEEISRGNTGIYVPASDISEIDLLSKSIEHVRELVENQEQAKLCAEQDNFNKTEFLASTAHELKNIVSGITGLAEIVKTNLEENSKSTELPTCKIEENKVFLNDIIKLGEELSSFIIDITDINQSQTGDFKIEEQSLVDIKDLTLRSIKLMKIRTIKSKQHINFHYSEKAKEDFLIKDLDPRRTKQIIVNLISNSIKYSKENSNIDVILETLDHEVAETIRYSIIENIKTNLKLDKERKSHLLKIVKSSRPKIMLNIKDNGIGMTESEVKIALEKYGRVDSEKKLIDSTGLGLPLVKYLIEMQGGFMTISSKKNIGTEVKVFL